MKVSPGGHVSTRINMSHLFFRSASTASSRVLLTARAPSALARRPVLLSCARHLCKPPSDAKAAAAADEAAAASSAAKPPPDGVDAASSPPPPPPPPPQDELTTTEGAAGGQASGGGLAIQDHEGENLPPLAFEPGVAGAAQKGVSAVVIAFGAAAFGACAWGISLALFPSASSTQTIYSEAFDKVKSDPAIANGLGSPLRAHGIDHGGARGRRNEMERWDVTEAGQDLTLVRFAVSGPQGAGAVLVQVPAKRRRGEFKYIIFENLSCPAFKRRQLVHVLDTRADEAAAYEAEAAAARAAAAAKAAEEAKKEAPASAAPAA